MKKLLSSKLRLDYLMILIGMCFLGVVVAFKNSSLVKLELLIIISVIYIVSAFLHHHHDKSLTMEVIIEYILIALFAITIVSGAII